MRELILKTLAHVGECRNAMELHDCLQEEIRKKTNSFDFEDAFKTMVLEGSIRTYEHDFDDKPAYWLSERASEEARKLTCEGLILKTLGRCGHIQSGNRLYFKLRPEDQQRTDLGQWLPDFVRCEDQGLIKWHGKYTPETPESGYRLTPEGRRLTCEN